MWRKGGTEGGAKAEMRLWERLVWKRPEPREPQDAGLRTPRWSRGEGEGEHSRVAQRADAGRLCARPDQRAG